MNEKFGKRFKQLRLETNLKQKDFVDSFNSKYNFNFTRQAISLYETGKRIPEIDALTSFADYFGVTVDYLLGRTDIKRFEDFPPEVKRVTELFAGLDAPKAERLEKLLRELLEK